MKDCRKSKELKECRGPLGLEVYRKIVGKSKELKECRGPLGLEVYRSETRFSEEESLGP